MLLRRDQDLIGSIVTLDIFALLLFSKRLVDGRKWSGTLIPICCLILSLGGWAKELFLSSSEKDAHRRLSGTNQDGINGITGKQTNAAGRTVTRRSGR